MQVLEAQEKNQPQLTKFPLTEILHSKGINIRYIGTLLHHIPNQPQNKALKQLIVVEMIARVLKNQMR